MIDIDSLSVDELIDLRDACNRRLLELQPTNRRTLAELLQILEQIKTTLQDQGKHWRSLERWQWMDGQIHFWLNPTDQENYQLGWYTIDELIAWTHNRGPVLRSWEDELEEADEELDTDWTPHGGVQITWLPDETRNRNDGRRLYG